MRLYIVRHGEAEPATGADAQRPLTERGRRDVRALWQALAARGETPGKIISSPYVRAAQTAAEIAAVFNTQVARSSDLLVPEARPQDVFDWLLSEPLRDGTLLVSHMPLVSLLVGRLVDGGDARVPMSVGAVALLDIEVPVAAGGRLVWLRSPGEAF